MKVSIPLDHWLRGTNDGYFLKDGKYCVMGHILKARGVADTLMNGKGSIMELPPAIVKRALPAEFYEDPKSAFSCFASDLTARIEDVNDNPRITDDERMKDLKLFCEPYGFELEFIPCT
jgi:hypothetical protein